MDSQSRSPLNIDVMARILARVDGQTLAVAACTSSDLHAIAQEENLWQLLCHSTWPSTKDERINHAIASQGGFARFFANSFSLLVYRTPKLQASKGDVNRRCCSPSHLATLVDVFYDRKPIFSKVVLGFPEADPYPGGGWFMDCPFRLDVLQDQYKDSFAYGSDDEEAEAEGMYPSLPMEETMKGAIKGGRLCKELEEKVRLSWVVLDSATGRAVNLSSWKPLLVQRHWPTDDHVFMRFGCVVPAVEEGEEAAECTITVNCMLMKREGCLQIREIRMQVEDREGGYASGRRSLMVLERALGGVGSRSCKQGEFEEGYGVYVRDKKREQKLSNHEVMVFYVVLLLYACCCSIVYFCR